jgi:phage portal protein BeeE
MTRLLDRLETRYRSQGYYEGMASGGAVMMTYGMDANRETSAQQIAQQCRDAYQTNGIVFAVILARMMLFSEATFQFRSKADKRLFGNTSLTILERPAPNQTTGELLARMEQDVSLSGNSFIWKAEDDLLVRLPPDEITIVSRKVPAPMGGEYREIVGYDWDPRNPTPGLPNPNTGHLFTVDEIAHWSPYPDPQANFRGMSWLTPIIREIQADGGMTQYKTAYLDHAATPNMIVKYAQKLRPDTVDRVVERFQERFGGVENAWRPIVLDQGSDATVVGNTLGQLDFKTVQGAGETRIAAAGGVPPIVVGLSEGLASATYSNYQTAMRRFSDLTMRPLWRSVCAALEKFVPGAKPAGVSLWFDTKDIAALRQSEIEIAQVMQVHAATMLSLCNSGFTRESSIAAIVANDMTLLRPEAGVPPAGVHVAIGARETGTTTGEAVLPPIPGMGKVAGTAPPDQKVPSSATPQTAATKIPMPPAMAGKPSGKPSSNNGGRS